jgi:hypothetical protein
MHPVRQIFPSELEAVARQPFGQIGALRRRYRSRHRRRPVTSSYGDAVLAMAVKLDGFLAVFPPDVTPRTTTPDAAPYLSVNQRLTGY